MTGALFAAAAVFALASGLNAGATLLSLGLTIGSLPAELALLAMTAAVALAPPLVGTAVATTLATSLSGEGDGARATMLTAVVVTILVISILSRMSVPCSMTLALVGALAGAGLGSGQPPAPAPIVTVLAMTVAAPVVGAMGSAALTSVIAPSLPLSDVGRAVRATHMVAFGLLCFAYGANDAQKMLAVFAVAAGTAEGHVAAVPWQLISCAGLFALGSVSGLRRMSRASTRLVPARPQEMVTTEVSTGGTMLFCAVLGAPVGLAQTISGSLVGAAIPKGVRRIRWGGVGSIAVSWIATLPASFVVAFASAVATGVLCDR